MNPVNLARAAGALVLLLVCCLPLTAQEPLVADSTSPLPVIPAPSLVLPDSASTAVIPAEMRVERAPLSERALKGAMVGAVTGAVLAEQGSECAPSESSVAAALFGATWGAVRSALGWPVDAEPRPGLRPRDGREPAPFPFDRDACDQEDS